MYFWKTRKLAESLKNNDLAQSEYKNYYIASSVLVLICFYLSTVAAPRTPYVVVFEAVCSILVTIIGLNIIFNENGGNSGTRYLDRVISLSFPLIIKIIVAGIILALVTEALRQFNISAQQIDWFYSFAIVLIQILFFWRIKIHVQYITNQVN